MTKSDLHELVDSLPDESLDAAGVLLRRAQDPVVAVLEAAPYDDEPYTAGDREAVNHSLLEERISWEQARMELEAD